MATIDDYNASIFFAILILLVLVLGPNLSKKYFPEYLNVFSTEGFKALMILLVLFVSNGDAVLSLLITAIFVIIMALIKENNKKRLSDVVKPAVNNVKEGFCAGPPVSNCNTYDMEQSKFIGMPFYPMNDRNNLTDQTPYYIPELDYKTIDMNEKDYTNKNMPSTIVNLEGDNYNAKY